MIIHALQLEMKYSLNQTIQNQQVKVTEMIAAAVGVS